MIYIFGDSYTGPFRYLSNKSIRVYKYKGKTMRGISKNDITNTEANNLKKIISEKKPSKVILMFGQVDIVFSIYYEYIKMKNKNISKYIIETSQMYCNFLKELKTISPETEFIVFSIFPLMLDDEEAFHSLYLYGIIPRDIMNTYKERKIFKYKFRESCRLLLNNLNENFCKKNNITYINYDNVFMKNGKYNEIYKIKESKMNIHPYFEIAIKGYLKKLPYIKPYFNVDLDKQLEEYKKEKINQGKDTYDNIPLLKY